MAQVSTFQIKAMAFEVSKPLLSSHAAIGGERLLLSSAVGCKTNASLFIDLSINIRIKKKTFLVDLLCHRK